MEKLGGGSGGCAAGYESQLTGYGLPVCVGVKVRGREVFNVFGRRPM